MQGSKAYWITTALFCLALTGSGVAHLFKLDPIPAGMESLGFPLYVTTLLGLAKLAGVVTLLIPGQPRLKEWAYAGFTFNLLGASASHVMAGDAFSHAVPPLVLVALAAASYHFRPDDRRL